MLDRLWNAHRHEPVQSKSAQGGIGTVTKYETTFILDPGLDEAKVNEEVDHVVQWIKGQGGEVLEVQRWGKRRLAYEIGRRRDGIYTLLLYQGPGAIVKELERRFRLNESVLRSLTVLHVPPELTQPQVDAEALAAAAEEAGDE
jgi:small subunit ribosomal protein S6